LSRGHANRPIAHVQPHHPHHEPDSFLRECPSTVPLRKQLASLLLKTQRAIPQAKNGQQEPPQQRLNFKKQQHGYKQHAD
jgi:hypothetical protein